MHKVAQTCTNAPKYVPKHLSMQRHTYYPEPKKWVKLFCNNLIILIINSDIFRSGYDLIILAVPCNGIVECDNGIDEKYCWLNDYGSYLGYPIMVLFFIFTFGAWINVYYKVKKEYKPNDLCKNELNNMDKNNDNLYAFESYNDVDVYGDELATLKVVFSFL